MLAHAPRHVDVIQASKAFEPHQLLAVEVLAQAVRDAQSVRSFVRAPAVAFLRDGSPEFRFWCAVAGVDHPVVQRHARHFDNIKKCLYTGET